MARKKMAPRRRRNNGIKLLNVAEAYVQANIVTQSLMQTDPISFVVGDAGPTLTVSGGGISLIEIVRNPQLIGTIGARAAIPDNIIDIAVKSFVANVGFKFAKRALRRPINMFNRQIMKPLALGVSL